MGIQVGFQLTFRALELWLFPEAPALPEKFPSSITYTMSGDSKALTIGTSSDVGDFALALLGKLGDLTGADAALKTKATEAKTAATNLLNGFTSNLPEPFGTVASDIKNLVASTQFQLESLRVTLTVTSADGVTPKTYKTSYEIGISMLFDKAAPAPLDSLRMKRVFLKIAS